MISSFKNVTAAILAGGLGTRLRSAISDLPKVLAPIDGRPFLTFLLDQLVEARIRETVLLVAYRGDLIQQEFGDSYRGMRLSYSFETELFGTCGAVRLALPMLRSKTILLMNGDSYCELDFRAFLEFHTQHQAKASLAMTRVNDASRFGRVAVEDAGIIRRFEEKDWSAQPGWINAGIYLFDRLLFETIPQNRKMSLERELLPNWILEPGVFGFRGGRFIDIGLPESYAEAERFFASLSERIELESSLTLT
jgi:D-glycero-alpha-D-manno-heptose 1-phosphate guanylyltransferase